MVMERILYLMAACHSAPDCRGMGCGDGLNRPAAASVQASCVCPSTSSCMALHRTRSINGGGLEGGENGSNQTGKLWNPTTFVMHGDNEYDDSEPDAT